MEFNKIAAILGGQKVLGKQLYNKMDLVELGNEGLSKIAVGHLAKHLSIPVKEMIDLLPVTRRTLQRYALKKHLNRPISEQVIQIAEVVARGTEVFGNKDKFLTWINLPNAALSNKTPYSLLKSRFGTEIVIDELGRIEHGVY
jgi:putative toxin-antitoxin system antitoxin component (TIGR02293 family)